MPSFNYIPGSQAVATSMEAFKTNAEELVNERFQYALDYATQAFENALSVFDSIKQMAGDIEDIDVDLMLEDYDLPNPEFSNFDIPDPSDYGVEVGQLDPSNLSFNWNDESIYSSNLLSQLKTKLTTDMTSGTGISSTVENDMITRETERDAVINATARTEIETEWAEQGWEMPDGIEAYNLTQLEDAYQNKRLDKSRDIRVESFNLAQKNIQFATGVATDIEGKLMMYTGQMMERKLQAAKALIDVSIQIFKTRVDFLLSKVEIYKAVIDGFKARILLESEKSKIDVAIFEAKVRQVLGRAGVLVEKARVLITQYIEQNKLRLTAMQEAGQIAATVAAGALTGVSAQAQVSSSDSSSASGSVSYEGNESHNYDDTGL